MKLILLTGLDGSGKSTLINRLEEISEGQPIAFIRVPKIDSELFRHHREIYDATKFINQMHVDGDALKRPQLKAIALFSSMLIFKELLNELKQKHIKLIFCERHPLIDTGVYAKFYSGKMDPMSLPGEILNDIEKKYSKELFYLLGLIGIQKSNDNNAFHFLQFIHNWFSTDQKHGLNDLKELFNIELPDKIFYLSASPEILMSRLEDRKHLEAHESKAVLGMLIPVYEKVLSEVGLITTVIDASSFSNLDKAYEEIKRNYFL